MSRNLQCFFPLTGGYGYAFLLDTYMLPGSGRYKSFDCLGTTNIDMVNINRVSTSVSYITNDELHTLKIYEED